MDTSLVNFLFADDAPDFRRVTEEEAIGRLQEYRAALITAAVTGKIDVRGSVVHNAATDTGTGKDRSTL